MIDGTVGNQFRLFLSTPFALSALLGERLLNGQMLRGQILSLRGRTVAQWTDAQIGQTDARAT
jgi:hypothetical protein